jgi:hypothetical protein
MFYCSKNPKPKKREVTLQNCRKVPSGKLADEEEPGKGAPANLRLLVAQAASRAPDGSEYGEFTTAR